MSVLATAAGLADELAFSFRLLADGLAIGHLRLAYVGFNLVLAHHAIDDDLQVKLTHTADDGLSRIGIGVNLKGGIFLSELRERHAHLFLVGLGLGLNGDRDDRRRKFNRLEHDWRAVGADGVAGSDVLQPNAGADVAGVDLIDLFALIGVHL